MIAIINGKVMTITHGTLDGATVLVEGGRIVAVGKQVEIPEDAQPDFAVDTGGIETVNSAPPRSHV